MRNGSGGHDEETTDSKEKKKGVNSTAFSFLVLFLNFQLQTLFCILKDSHVVQEMAFMMFWDLFLHRDTSFNDRQDFLYRFTSYCKKIAVRK